LFGFGIVRPISGHCCLANSTRLMGSTVVHKFNPTQRPAYHAASLNNGTVTQSRTHPTLASEPIVAKLAPSSSPISLQSIERRILLIRGLKVMLDSDLANLYQVPTKRLNESVRRNISRFPDDFAFELSPDEVVSLRSQFATSNAGRGGSRYAPYVFTEHGVAMLSSVLRSERAVHVNIAIMRAFSRLRELLATHADLARKLDDLEQRYDRQFRVVFDAIRELMGSPSEHPTKEIGFRQS